MKWVRENAIFHIAKGNKIEKEVQMKGNIHGGKQLGNGKRLTLVISEDIHAKLLECAKDKQLTVSDITRVALREYLAREKANA